MVHSELFIRQEDYLSCLFATFFDPDVTEQDSTASLASRLMSGSRLPPRSLIRTYEDRGNPRTPENLVTDIRYCLDLIHHQKPSLLVAIRQALVEVHMLLPEEDRNDLLTPVPSSSSIEPLSRFWAELLWYAMCQDYVQSKTSSLPIKPIKGE